IGRQTYKDSDKEDLDHSKKLKGIETLSDVAQFMINMKKTRKASKDDFLLQQHSKGSCEGSGVIPEIPNELIDILNNSSSESDDEIEDISSDDEISEADDIEKIEKVRLTKLMMTKLKKRRLLKNKQEMYMLKLTFLTYRQKSLQHHLSVPV
ncbi:hypothetical protein Tco_0958326, partial [Tanacetum coccineum]